MYENFFKQLGLTEAQSSIYLRLIENGPSTARKISNHTKIPRTLCYKVLDDMTKLGVIYRENDSPVATFYPSSPSKFNDLITKKKEELALLDATFGAVAGLLGAEWNRMWGKPSISLYEGVEGVKKIYEDILHSKVSDIFVVSSPFDKGDDMRGVIKNQIVMQGRRGIRTKAITPLHENFIPATRIEEDKENLITRKIVSKDELPIPAQIIIYGDKVAITNFSDNVTNFVIQHKKAAETFKLIFNFLWEKIN